MKKVLNLHCNYYICQVQKLYYGNLNASYMKTVKLFFSH